MITRATDAVFLNRVLNDPAVRPWVANDEDGVLDMTSLVAAPGNVTLVGEHGGVMFLRYQPGIYEAHTQVLPSGRGAWTREMTEACAHHMFTRTDAYEITTRVPAGHVAARAATEAQGLKFEFTRPGGCRFRNKTVDSHLFSMRLQDWAMRAPGLVDVGRRIHERMESEAVRLGIGTETHDDDENHNRYVGAAAAMAFGGQVRKGVLFYNRWVSMARHIRAGKLQYVEYVSSVPPVIRFDIGLMRFSDDDIKVIPE